MALIAHKKQIGMYTFTLSENGTLQIQAPTLLKPVIVDARQTLELAQWLAELHQIAPGNSSSPMPQPVQEAVPVSTSTPVAAPSTSEEVAESPEDSARRAIRETVSAIDAQNPEMLAPENRDRLLEQVLRQAAIRPLLAQGKVSRKQVLLWVDQIV